MLQDKNPFENDIIFYKIHYEELVKFEHVEAFEYTT